MHEHEHHTSKDSMDHASSMGSMGHDASMDHAGAGGHASSMGSMGHMGNLKQKFFVSLVLAIPVLILSPMMGIKLPFQVSFPGSQWVVLVLASVLYFYGGKPFLAGALHELKARKPAMMTLIALGISAAYFYSLYAFIVNNFTQASEHVMDFFWELATLIVIMLLGHWIEMRAISGAGDALGKMAELLPAEASVLQEDGSYKVVPVKDLQIGQTVIVKPSEKIPADGTVVEGSTTVNESMVTGEARQVQKSEGSSVIGGSLNGAGSVTIKVTGTGESGYLAHVMELVGSAQKEKSRSELISDKVARLLFYAATSVGLVSLILWYAVTLDFGLAITRMVTVLVIACPHALGLAIPLVVARSTSLGAKNGLLVRKRQALEVAPRVNMVMMDKTGTLTEGSFTVKKVLSSDEAHSEKEILAAMAALETGSSHPLATSIINKAKAEGIPVVKAEKIENLPGIGIEGVLPNGAKAMISTAAYLDKKGLTYSTKDYKEFSGKGYTVSFLVVSDKVWGMIAQGDEIRKEASELVKGLQKQNITPMMLTGDNQAAALKVATILSIKEFRAGLLPEQKGALVTKYQEEGKVVMMVGDGVNDAPSLAKADVGAAIGAGTDIAIDSADVVLVKSNPEDILHFIRLAKNTSKKMKQNLWWGAGYNGIAIPLAAGVLAPVGIILSPAVGALLMSLSTVVVAINALMLKAE